MAMPFLWLRQPDTIGVLGLAINACAERDGHAETTDRIGELLETAAATLVDASRSATDDADRFAALRALPCA